jgi:hypothetical protein
LLKKLISSFAICEHTPLIIPWHISKMFVCKVAVMLVAVWSISDFTMWNAHTNVETWRRLAVDYIRAGAEGDMEWLASSVLGSLLPKEDK